MHDVHGVLPGGHLGGSWGLQIPFVHTSPSQQPLAQGCPGPEHTGGAISEQMPIFEHLRPGQHVGLK